MKENNKKDVKKMDESNAKYMKRIGNNMLLNKTSILLKLISECTDYDFKEQLEIKKPKSWLKTVSAFSNGLGGTLFFGVSDNKELVGISNPQYVCEKISELINSRISPVPTYILEPYIENNLVFLILKVFSGLSTPYYYCADGIREVYYRSGNQSISAPRYILEELILKGQSKTYDSIITTKMKNDYSFSYLEATFLEETHTRFTENDFISFSLMNKKGNLTNAGVLMADQNIYRHNRIFCTRWNGIDKTSLEEASNDAEYSGSIVRILDSALNFIKLNNKKKWKKGPKGRIEMPDYDDIAIRETIVNAVIHRQYTVVGSEVTVDIYDDRIVVTSPGGMVSGMMIDAIPNIKIPSFRRNPILADIFARMNYMDRRGSGLDKIRDRTNVLFNDEREHVEFHANETHFSVTLYNSNYIKNEKIAPEIVHEIKMNPSITIKALSKKLKKSERTIKYSIKKMRENGIIYREGSQKKGKWIINSFDFL